MSQLDSSLGGSRDDSYDFAATSERMRAWDALYEKQLAATEARGQAATGTAASADVAPAACLPLGGA